MGLRQMNGCSVGLWQKSPDKGLHSLHLAPLYLPPASLLAVSFLNVFEKRNLLALL